MKQIKLQISLICLGFMIAATKDLSILPRCPEGFAETKTFCYTLSKKGSFFPECPYQDMFPFYSYRDEISEKEMGPIWMPAERNSSYTTVFSENFFVSDTAKCLLFYNNSYIVATPCDQQHPRICASGKSHFCSQLSEQLTWPTTEVGMSTEPTEFCFLSNGSRPLRFCNGDSTSGARWAPLGNLACEMAIDSSVSRQLINLLGNSTLEAVKDLHTITQRYQELNYLDIYLIGRFLEGIQVDRLNDDATMEIYQILDNILFADKDVLRQAREKTNATENLLGTMRDISASRSVSYHGKNFFCFSSSLGHTNGVIVRRQGDAFVADLQTPLTGLNETLATRDFVCAFWLNLSLQSQLTSDKKVIFVVYYEDGFFTDTSTPIFDFRVVKNFTFNGPINLICNVTSDASFENVCALWDSNGTSSWKKHNVTKDRKPFYECEFWDIGNFAMVASPKGNITDDLSDILVNDYSAPETMSRLVEATELFDDFTPEDVYLVGRILGKLANGSTEIDVEILARVISNSLKIDKTVLRSSQFDTLATDLILYNIDDILKNVENQSKQVITVKDNFAIFWTDLGSTGLVVLTSGQTTQIKILDDNSIIDEIILWENFTSALVLTPGLKKQIGDSKVIVTVFFDDNFFNQTDSIKTIFGVILPEIGRYSGPVSTFHQMSQTHRLPKCVHWSYDPSENISGSWSEDADGSYALSAIRCDFWHATHLGLLLQEDEHEDEFLLMAWANAIDAALSFFGFFGILLTAASFRKWRRNKGNQILLNFVTSIMIHTILFCVSGHISRPSKGYVLCVTLGALLHYFVLSQFSWMFVIGILQFKRFVIVFGSTPKYLLLKACVFGWGLPSIFVCGVLILDRGSYLNAGINFCYPSGLSLALAVWLPIGIAVVFNLVVFVFILYSVCCKKLECGDVGSYEVLHQWRLALLLFFLLGITWSFGLLANLKLGIVFVYLFDFTVNLQGFVLFLYFIVLNANTRNLYVEAFKRCRVCRNR